MKTLHTSDWHLGQKLYDFDRKDEQIHFLRQIADIVKNEKPDAMIVSGDIFHVATPNIETQTMFVDELLNIHNQCDTMTIVVTAGNHDSYSRLEIDKKLWDKLHIYVIGNVSSNVEEHLINICSKGWIAAVPYSSGRNFPQLSEDETFDRQTLYFNALQEKAKELNTENLPVILSAHLAVFGSNVRGHKIEKSTDGQEIIGGLEYSDANQLGDYYDYIALGHIHHPQYVGCGKRIRYCGTPMAITFNEEYEHSVTIIDIDKHDDVPDIKILPINELRPVRTLPEEDFFEPKGETVENIMLLLNKIKDEDVYLRLNIKMGRNDNAAEINERIINALGDKDCHKCRYCSINPIREDDFSQTIENQSLSLDEIKEMTANQIVEIAKQVKDLDDNQQEMLIEIIGQIEKENDTF